MWKSGSSSAGPETHRVDYNWGLNSLSPAEPWLLNHVSDSELLTFALWLLLFFPLLITHKFTGMGIVILTNWIKRNNGAPEICFILPDKTFSIKQDQSSSRRSAEHTFIDFITTQGIVQDQHVCMPFLLCSYFFYNVLNIYCVLFFKGPENLCYLSLCYFI